MKSKQGYEPGNALDGNVAQRKGSRERLTPGFVRRLAQRHQLGRRPDQDLYRPKIFIDDAIPRRDLLRNLLCPVNTWIGFLPAEVEQKIFCGLSSRPYAQDDFLQISRLARGQFRQAEKRRRTFHFLQCGSDLPEHAKRVGYSTQCARIQKRARGQIIAAALESPEAGEQIAAVYSRDVAWMQRLQRAQIVPIKKMAFKTLELAQRFQRAKVARHQVVDCDVTKIIGRHGRQHPQPDVRRRSAQENIPLWRFLDIVRRQPGSLWSNKIIEVSPSPPRGRAQEPAIVRR